MEEAKTYQVEKRSLKQALEEDFITGKKTIEEIAQELGIKPFLVKAQAARLGYIEKKEKPEKEEISSKDTEISLDYVKISGKFSYNYNFREKKLSIRQDDKRRLILPLNEVDEFMREIGNVVKQINSLVS